MEDLTNSSETIRIFTQSIGKRATNNDETIGIFPKGSVRIWQRKAEPYQ